MKEYMETLREIVDECVGTPNCKTCPCAREGGKYCIIGFPVTWQLSYDMEAEGFWDPEVEEADDLSKSDLPPQGVELFHRLTSLHHACEKYVYCCDCPLHMACTVNGVLPVKIPVSIYPSDWTRADRRLIVRRLLHLE